MKRLAIYFFYDAEGIVDDYVIYFLKKLYEEQIEILFVVNGSLSLTSREKVAIYVKEILVRENIGFDVWAYKEGIEHLGYDVISEYSDLILLNHTNFGPIFPLSELFNAMDDKNLDFWGITKSLGNGEDILPHIQSHFTVLSQKILISKDFKLYWQNCPQINTFEDALYKHEFIFTMYLEKLGYKWDVYIDINEFEGNLANPLLVYPLYCVSEKRCPIIKRKSFFLEDSWLYQSKLYGKMTELLEYVQEETDYDINMIWENLLRTQSMRTLMKTMNLYHINRGEKSPIKKNVALVIDVIETDNLQHIKNYIIQENIALYFVCTQENISKVTKEIYGISNIKFIIKYSKLPAIWQKYEELTEYDMVGYVQTGHLNGELSDSFKLYNIEDFDNMLENPEYIGGALIEFKKNSRLGMLVSGVQRTDIHLVYAWHYFFNQFNDFCRLEGVRGSSDYKVIPAYYNTDFCWIRGKLLSKIWLHSEKMESQIFGLELTKFFIVEILRTEGYYSVHQISDKKIYSTWNICDYYEINRLEEIFNKENSTEKIEIGKSFLKQMFYEFPKLKAFLKQLYNRLREMYINVKMFNKRHKSIIEVEKYIKSSEIEQMKSEAEMIELDKKWKYEVFSNNFSENIDSKHLHIAFLVPKPIKGGGGHRNIYRAVRFLAEYGHQIDVYHSDCKDELGPKTKECISEWFYPMQENIRFISYAGEIGKCDVCIACWWELAYELDKNIKNIRFPFYLVQDYEAAFYPMSSSALMAENSYKLGFSHICSGRWCKEFLEKKYNAEAAYFTFPVDHKIYNTDKLRTKTNKNIVFFAKPEMPRRCYELGIRALSIVKKNRPDIEIILYGSNQVDWIPCEVTTKGVLPTLQDLADLYRNADIGVVFSTTNPSLVPYEMMLCGCPVVDVDMDQAIMKYGNDENNVFLFDTQPDLMAKQILNIIDDSELLRKKAYYGKKWVTETFPTEEEMGRIVERFIINKVNTGKMI